MDEKILAELSLDEYIYLTENLEVIEHGGDKNAAAYILARLMGADAALMAALITTQTLVALLSLPLWVSWLS